MTAGFGARLRTALDAYGPLCVGIDPHVSLVEEWGLEASPGGIREYEIVGVSYAG